LNVVEAVGVEEPRHEVEIVDVVDVIGSSGWIRTSNPPVNRQDTKDLLRFPEPCSDALIAERGR
jgi:hypothetical protein